MPPRPAVRSPSSGQLREPRARHCGMLLLMSVPLQSRTGPVAVWITAAGWASAARRLFEHSWLLSPAGVVSPEQARALASCQLPGSDRRRGPGRWVPVLVRTLLKDVGQAVHARRLAAQAVDGPWNEHHVDVVWQRHDLFYRAGVDVARFLDCPLIIFVDAPVVWEAAQWGVRRPGWGRLLERVAEGRILQQADVVACVSEEVAVQLVRLGVDPHRIVVTPCSVDPLVFRPDAVGTAVRATHGLDGRFVVGWTGSFRRFHGLDVLIEAFGRFLETAPNARLLLVGDGAERPRLERRVERAGLADHVEFTGTVEHARVPEYVAAMDVAVLTAPGEATFHYSPLKLKEYMACGRPVIAPRIGQVPGWLEDGSEGLLVRAGDAEGLAKALGRLHRGPALRVKLGAAAARRVQREGTWEAQLERVLGTLVSSGGRRA